LRVGVLLAVYRPNMEFFIKLLTSIANQTYTNLKIYICDDSEDEQEFDKISAIVQRVFNEQDYELLKNDKNLGSNKTFEKLTQIAVADFFCYCDQDDIWEIDKISKLLNHLMSYTIPPKLIYSDLRLIDASDCVISESFKENLIRLEHVYGKGQDVFSFLLRRNSVTGCAMMIDSAVAKNSLPFPVQSTYVHDHWLTINAALNGEIAYLEDRLVNYRIHGGNQIGNNILSGINDKDEYYQLKIMSENARINILSLHLRKKEKNYQSNLEDYIQFLDFRKKIFEKKFYFNLKDFRFSIKYDSRLILFEVFIAKLPKVLSSYLLKKVKKK